MITEDTPFIRDQTAVLDVDGRSVVVRPIVPSDRAALASGLAELSPRSRVLRFFRELDGLSNRELRYLTELDYDDHFAWVAYLPGPEPVGLGVARYIRLNDEPTVAEAAAVVRDGWQRKGIGGALVSLLAHSAVDHGIRAFRMYVLADNESLVDRLRSEQVTAVLVDSVFEVDVTLPLSAPSEAATSVLDHIARASG